jgi:DNA-binding GntR family transcriptional regulator
MSAEEARNDVFRSTLDRNKTLLEGSLLSDRVYTIIRKSVISGELQPGQRVVESEIARLLAVSQAPVRDAVKRLAHEGLLTHVPRRGHFVTEVSEEDERQAREVRTSLEELAGRLAAQNANEEELNELQGLVTALRSAGRRNDLAQFRDLDIAFHAGVCEASHNAFLVRLWKVMEPSWRALRAVADPLFEGDWLEMAEEHGRLVDLLRARDAEKAAVAFARHAGRKSPVPDRRRPRA